MVLGLFSTAVGASAANLITNGGFEASPATDTFLPIGTTAITGWTVGGAPGSTVHFASGIWTNQFVDLTGNTGRAYLEQTFATTAGKTYLVTLNAFNGSPLFSTIGQVTGPAFAVSATGNLAQNVTMAPGTGTLVSYQFRATGAATTLRFTELTGADSNASWIDNVIVEEVVTDTTPPVIVAPVSITKEATGPNGAVVTFSVSATDDVSGVVPVTASPASGSTFALGTTAVRLSAVDAAGNPAVGQFPVKVVDSTAPVVTASLVNLSKGGDDESTQLFRVVFAATDVVGINTVQATLNGIAVTNGQVVQLQVVKSGSTKIEREDGRLKIKATAFTLTVTASDTSRNLSTNNVSPVFIKNGKNDDDKKDDGKSEDRESDDRKKS